MRVPRWVGSPVRECGRRLSGRMGGPADALTGATRCAGRWRSRNSGSLRKLRRNGGGPYQRLRRKNSHKTATIMTIHNRGWTTRPNTAAMTTIITAIRMSSNTVVSVPDHRTGQTSRRRRRRTVMSGGPGVGFRTRTILGIEVLCGTDHCSFVKTWSYPVWPARLSLVGCKTLSWKIWPKDCY